MALRLAFLVVVLFLVFNGAVLAISPRKWMSGANRLIRFAWGKEPGFRYSPEGMTAKDFLQWRLFGGIAVLLGGAILTQVVYLAWLSGRAAAPSAARKAPEATGWAPIAGLIFLALWAVYGALLVVNPRWTLRFFGTARHIDVSDRFLWVFRVIGAGLVLSGAYAIFR